MSTKVEGPYWISTAQTLTINELLALAQRRIAELQRELAELRDGQR